ncbi:hypothetical protein FHS57_001960 [Runella defluvii]|uniref:Uncharacterized protein n=1 Tax=Runella defluvii TaxID=370973 RepID=A0A7W5ZIM4_9BACT|nr:hypothetical protein [Runella defluvii]
MTLKGNASLCQKVEIVYRFLGFYPNITWYLLENIKSTNNKFLLNGRKNGLTEPNKTYFCGLIDFRH